MSHSGQLILTNVAQGKYRGYFTTFHPVVPIERRDIINDQDFGIGHVEFYFAEEKAARKFIKKDFLAGNFSTSLNDAKKFR